MKKVSQIYKHVWLERKMLWAWTLTCILSDNNSCLDDPLEDGETPTSAHATLKTLVDNLIQDTVQNPYIKVMKLSFHLYLSKFKLRMTLTQL